MKEVDTFYMSEKQIEQMKRKRRLTTTIENLAAMSERSWSLKRICDNHQYQAKCAVVLDKIFLLIAAE